MNKKQLTAIIKPTKDGNVDVRLYNERNEPIIKKDGLGEDYHAGQISSNHFWGET